MRHQPGLFKKLLMMGVTALALASEALSEAPQLFQLRLLHMNDLHSRFQQVTSRGSSCTDKHEKRGECVGGVSRIKYKVEGIRREHHNKNSDNVLFLMAGDLFQGTLWYSKFKWRVVANLTSDIGLDATSLGNHEFDDGLGDLNQFVQAVPYAIITDNVRVGTTAYPKLQEKLLPYKIFIKRYGGLSRKVGVIGYVTPETKQITSGGRESRFILEEESLAQNVQQLKSMGVDIIVAVGHSGYKRDLEIASKVEGIDIVIGGHTNTFLWSGEKPPNYPGGLPLGKYPSLVTRSNGEKTLVVQTNGYGRYLGDLTVDFDESGKVVSWRGLPIYLNNSVLQDPGLQARVDWYGHQLKELMGVPIGLTQVDIFGGRPACRLTECNVGNFIADAMVDQTKAAIGVVNSGSFKQSLKKGNITTGDLYSVLPYNNEVDVIKIHGKTLRLMLEGSVRDYDATHPDPGGNFLQVSGLQVVFDPARSRGQRVVSLRAASKHGQSEAEYQPVQDDLLYEVAISSFLVGGGDGFDMLNTDTLIEHKNMGLLGKDLLTNFVKYKTPVTCVPCTGKRISFVNQEKVDARPETCSSRCLWSSNKKDSNSKTTFSQAIHNSPPSRSSLSTQVIFLFCMIQSITLIF